jgi:hypothetical protein
METRALRKGYLLLDRLAMVKAGKVTPGNAAESILYKRINGAVEPIMPDGGPKLPEGDIAVIRRWIDEGAPDWKVSPSEPRRFISNEDVISAIEKDLTSAGTDTSRRFYRYFTLTNLYNAGDAKLTTYRAALSKLINSLSWDRDIHVPAIIDKEQTILRIDIREYDWTDPAGTWETILAGYPYGVEFSGSAYARLQALTSSQIPFIRADWFLAAASMPPLYHDILELPTNEAELELCGRNFRRCLNIDAQRNLQDSAGPTGRARRFYGIGCVQQQPRRGTPSFSVRRLLEVPRLPRQCGENTTSFNIRSTSACRRRNHF